ncbi:hypothetical protein CCACVL1_14162 [Corchorus capsularis]|uniref:Uncharacterized protein n=1 Tax=Corchorus capsularis TaxID=210143 RepID=A0A1R3I845_COCAP|nr:hypothetical protein CCACVL1_14162 [Corchorus capsularis]
MAGISAYFTRLWSYKVMQP